MTPPGISVSGGDLGPPFYPHRSAQALSRCRDWLRSPEPFPFDCHCTLLLASSPAHSPGSPIEIRSRPEIQRSRRISPTADRGLDAEPQAAEPGSRPEQCCIHEHRATRALFLATGRASASGHSARGAEARWRWPEGRRRGVVRAPFSLNPCAEMLRGGDSTGQLVYDCGAPPTHVLCIGRRAQREARKPSHRNGKHPGPVFDGQFPRAAGSACTPGWSRCCLSWWRDLTPSLRNALRRW